MRYGCYFVKPVWCLCVCAVVLPGMNVVRASLVMFTAHSLHHIFVSYTLLRLYST